MTPRILIAPDKFKGSLDAWEVAQAIARGLRSGGVEDGMADLRLLPIADGGEGTAQVIQRACGGGWVSCPARDALGRPVEAGYALVRQDGIWVAVLEMSQAAGLWRLRKDELGRRNASTRGVGDLILDAVSRGAERILLGLGGSATNDGGVGMAEVLGLRFLDKNGVPVGNLPEDLGRVQTVDFSTRRTLPEIVAACDVNNPLLGPQGCTRIFGPQKGIGAGEIAAHEAGLKALADAVVRGSGKNLAEIPGAGAAGGMGFGCLAFAGARLEGGFGMVARLLKLEEQIQAASLVITGEGSLDRQTLNGKGPHGVALLGRKWGKPVLAFCGVSDECPELRRAFDEIRALRGASESLEDCMRLAGPLLEARARSAAGWVIRKIAG